MKFCCHSFPFTTQSRLLTTVKKKLFENIVGKGEIAVKQQFLLFLNAFYPSHKEFLLLTHSHTMTPFDASNKPFENTVGKGEIARNEQFLLYPQCFLPV